MIWNNKSTDTDDETVWIKKLIDIITKTSEGRSVTYRVQDLRYIFFVFFFPFFLFLIVITERFLVTFLLKKYHVCESSWRYPLEILSFLFFDVTSLLVQESNRHCRVCCTSRKCILIPRDRSITIQRRRECDLSYFSTALSRWWSLCQS